MAPRKGRGGRTRGRKANETVELPQADQILLLDQRNDFARKLSVLHEFARNTPVEELAGVPPIRQSFAMADPSDPKDPDSIPRALTNHFAVALPKSSLYIYRVIGLTTEKEEEEGNKPSRTARETFMKAVIEQHDILSAQQDHFAYDSFGLIVAWKDLSTLGGQAPMKVNDTQDMKVCLRPAKDNIKAAYRDLELKFEGQLALDLYTATCNGSDTTLPIRLTASDTNTVEQAINVIISKSTQNSDETPPFRMGSRKLFQTMAARENIVTGVNVHQGYFSTLKLGMGRPLLNLNTTAGVFWKEMPVRDYLQDRSDDLHKAKRSLRGVRVRVTYLDNRIKTIKDFGKQPKDQEFQKTITWKTDPKTGKDVPDKTEKCTVYDNLVAKRYKAIDLSAIEQSEYGCANIGSTKRNKEEWYPIECLEIVPYQPYTGGLTADGKSDMIDTARVHPGNGRDLLRNAGLKLLGVLNHDKKPSVLDKAGVSISAQMLQVPIRSIAVPKIRYAQDKSVAPNANGRWTLQGIKLFDTATELDGPIYLIIPKRLREISYRVYEKTTDENGQTKNVMDADKTPKFDEYEADRGEEIASSIKTGALDVGIRFSPTAAKLVPLVEYLDLTAADGIEAAFDSLLNDAKSKKAALVVLLNEHKKNTKVFDEFKRAADQRHGVQSLCLADSSLSSSLKAHLEYMKRDNVAGKTWSSHIANVALKINLKLGNTNHTVRDEMYKSEALRNHFYDASGKLDTIILGADATHVQKESAEGTPSLAAVVGSVDDHFGKFLGSLRPQEANTEVSAFPCTY